MTVTCFVVVTSTTNIMKSVYKEILLGLCSLLLTPQSLTKIISYFIIIYQFTAVIFIIVVHCMILVTVDKSKKQYLKKIQETKNRSIFIQLLFATLSAHLDSK